MLTGFDSCGIGWSAVLGTDGRFVLFVDGFICIIGVGLSEHEEELLLQVSGTLSISGTVSVVVSLCRFADPGMCPLLAVAFWDCCCVACARCIEKASVAGRFG